jgi:hypothetical protein
MTMSGSFQMFLIFHRHFSKSKGSARFFNWPKSKNQCWMSSSHLLMEVSNLTTETSCQYKLCINEFDLIINCFGIFLNTSTWKCIYGTFWYYWPCRQTYLSIKYIIILCVYVSLCKIFYGSSPKICIIYKLILEEWQDTLLDIQSGITF